MNRGRNRKLNMPRNNRGMPRGGMQHADSIKTQARDVYSNPRFLDTFARLKGMLVSAQMKSGVIYEGILHTISSKGEVVFTDVVTKDPQKQSMVSSPNSTTQPKLICRCSSIVKITAKEVDFDYSIKSDTFVTDAEISQRVNGQLPERKLEQWQPEDDEGVDDRLLEAELETDGLTKGNGWDAQEMFALNQRNFGYTSTYKEDLQEYTTPLDKEDTKEYRDRLARAQRLADEIEHSPDHAVRGQIENNDEMTEEERFSSVVRVSQGPNSRSSPSGPSSNSDKYVPPQKRPGAGPYPRGAGPARKSPLSGSQNTGPGRPLNVGTDRQSNQPTSPQSYIRPPLQPTKQQVSTSAAGHIGAMSNDYNRIQPQQSSQPQSSKQHHPHLQQSVYQPQRSPGVASTGGVGGSRGQSPTLSPMGSKQLLSGGDHEPARVPPVLPDKEPVTSTEAGMQVPDTISSQSSEARPVASNQPTVSLATDGKLSAKSTSKTKIMDDLKTFSQNLVLSEEKSDLSENKVPAAASPPHPIKSKVSDNNIPSQIAGVVTVSSETTSAQSEIKGVNTSPVSTYSTVVPKKVVGPTSESEKTETEKAQSSEKPQPTLNPNAKPFVPRGMSIKTPTPPPRSPPSMNSNAMIYAPMHTMVQYTPNQSFIVTSNNPGHGIPQFSQKLQQVQHAARGASNVPRMDFQQFSPALAAGQPLVSPMNIPPGPIIQVNTPGQGVQQGGMKMVPQTVVNLMKPPPQMQYRMPGTNHAAAATAAAAMHPQAQQMLAASDASVMMPPVMALHPSQANPQSQQHHQHQQGPAPSSQYIHTAPSHANAANQMQQQHHTTPPLPQSQQAQSGNHPVMAPQGQFPQHGGRPSPGPMQQMAHAQAQAQAQVVHQVNQQQGGMPQLVATVSQGQTIMYTPLPQTQHSHGIPTQHANQQYSNIQQHQHINQNMQVQPSHIPSNMQNITNVTRVHADPHPHSIPTAAAVYMNPPQQTGMVQSQHNSGLYMQQHGPFPTGN